MVPGGSTTTMFTRLPCGKRMSNLTLPTLAVGCNQGFQGDDKVWGSWAGWATHISRGSPAATSAVSLRPCSYIQESNIAVKTKWHSCASGSFGIICYQELLVTSDMTLGHSSFGRPEVPKAHSLALTCYGVLSWTICCKTSATWFQPELQRISLSMFVCSNNCPQCSTWHDHWSNAFARSIKTWPESVRWKTNVSGTKTPEKNNSLSFQQPCIAAAIKKCEAMHSQRLYLQWSWKMECNVSPTADHWTPTAWSMAVA